mgnify:CR=1 FL=1|tara:strand:+ start:1453 stop:1647 length:195 start_codon:yes stop_codon:yes gene_type:complete
MANLTSNHSSTKLKALTAAQRKEIANALTDLIEVESATRNKVVHHARKKSNRNILQQAMELTTA